MRFIFGKTRRMSKHKIVRKVKATPLQDCKDTQPSKEEM